MRDDETGLYYLQSRYYNTEIGAFISPDSVDYLDPENIGGLNLYCYCNNNPVINYDPTGHFVITLSAVLWAVGIGAAVGVASQFATDTFVNYSQHKFDFSEWEFSSWHSYVGAGIGGALGGAVSLVAGPAASALVDGFMFNMSTMILENISGVSNYSFGEVFATSLLVGGFSAVTAGLFEGVTTSSKEMINSFFEYSSKSLKSKAKIFKQNLINGLAYTSINTLFYNRVFDFKKID